MHLVGFTIEIYYYWNILLLKYITIEIHYDARSYKSQTIRSSPYNFSKGFVLLSQGKGRVLWFIQRNRKKWGVEMRSKKFARAAVRSVTDMCQNVSSSTKYFVAGSQTYKSALIPIGERFDVCAESGNVFVSEMLFEPTAVVSRLPPNKQTVCNTLVTT